MISCQTKDNTEMILKVFITTFMICKNDHLICFPLLPSLMFLYILTTWIQLLKFKYISKHLCKVIWPDQISVYNLIYQHLQLLQKMWQRSNTISEFYRIFTFKKVIEPFKFTVLNIQIWLGFNQSLKIYIDLYQVQIYKVMLPFMHLGW